MIAWFDNEGFLISAMRGGRDMEVAAPDGATTVKLADGADPNNIHYDMATGQVVERTMHAIAADRDMIAVGETAIVSGLPDPAWLLVNGVRQKVSGGVFRWMPSIASAIAVQLVGAQMSDPLVITADTVAAVEAAALAKIDAEREARQMEVLTPGGAKKYVYNRKASEAIDARTFIISDLDALNPIDMQKRFPFATAEAAQTGEQLSIVLTRYAAALDMSDDQIAEIEAQAQQAKRAVRAATTAAGKQAAANVNWSN